jgi:hypothetical protein
MEGGEANVHTFQQGIACNPVNIVENDSDVFRFHLTFLVSVIDDEGNQSVFNPPLQFVSAQELFNSPKPRRSILRRSITKLGNEIENKWL